MVLQRCDVLVDFMLTVQYLNLHAYISCIALHRGADAHAVVSSRRKLEVEAEDEVAILLHGVEVASEAGLWVHLYAAVFQRIVHQIARPLIHVGTVEEHLETFFLLLCRELERLLALQFLHVDVAEVALAAMCLQLQLLYREDRLRAVPVVLHDHIIYHQLSVEAHGYAVAHHLDVE